MLGVMRSLLSKVVIGVLAFAIVKGVTGGTVDVGAVWQALTNASQQVEVTVPEAAKNVLEPVMEVPEERPGKPNSEKNSRQTQN